MFLNDYSYSCVCICLYMCTHLHVSVHVCIVCVVYMCTCKCGHWRMMLSIFNHFPPYILRQGLSLDLDLSNFTGLSLASGSSPSSQHQDRRVTPPCCFTWMLGPNSSPSRLANSFPAEPFPQISPQLSLGKVAVTPFWFCPGFHHSVSQALAPSQSALRTNSVWEGQTDWQSALLRLKVQTAARGLLSRLPQYPTRAHSLA